MATLEEIQRLVDDAWDADPRRTKKHFIPKIKTALSQCSDLDPKFCRDLVKLIPKLLDDKTLEATFTTIDVKLLVKMLEAGIVPVSEPKVGPWPIK